MSEHWFAAPIQNPEKANPAPADLRVPGILARWPVIGLCMVLMGSSVFGAMVYNLQVQGPLLKWDVPLANYLHGVALGASVFMRDLMIAGFYMGKELMAATAVALSLYYLYKHYWRELAMVAAGFGGGGVIWFILSRLFNRPRPVFAHPIWIVLKEGGFPSGHTLTAVVGYGFLAYLLSSRLTSRFLKWVIFMIAVGIMLFIGYSRLFLGDHYLTDVLAGYGLGVFWAGLTFTSIEIFSDRWRDRYVKKGSTKTR